MDALARLLIERACERLIVDYARFVDFGEASRIAELFTEDGVWESEGLRMEGRSAIREGFARREGVRRRVSRHACTNVAVDVISADEARGLCYLINYRFDRREGDDPAAPAPAGAPKYVGEYHDRFVRAAEGWRFAHRICTLGFVRPPSR
jgi:SnoaL-like domain